MTRNPGTRRIATTVPAISWHAPCSWWSGAVPAALEADAAAPVVLRMMASRFILSSPPKNSLVQLSAMRRYFWAIGVKFLHFFYTPSTGLDELVEKGTDHSVPIRNTPIVDRAAPVDRAVCPLFNKLI